MIKISNSSSLSPRVLILQAANDELVPSAQSSELEETCRNLRMGVERKVISNALHNDVAVKAQGRREIVGFLEDFG